MDITVFLGSCMNQTSKLFLIVSECINEHNRTDLKSLVGNHGSKGLKWLLYPALVCIT